MAVRSKVEAMPLELLNQIKARLALPSPARSMVDDPDLVGESLLLLRMVLKDGELGQREVDVLRRVARSSYDLGAAELDDIVFSMRHFAQQASMGQAAAFYRSMEPDRRRLLARRLYAMMAVNRELKRREARFRGRLLELLDLRPDDLLETAA